jgi:hypothetical protein
MDKSKLALANLLAEVKLAEKQVEKAKAKLAPVEARIKQALIAGNRELAKKYALDLEEKKLELKRREQAVVLAKRNYAQGQEQASQQVSASTMRRMASTADAMSKMADSLGVLSSDDDMLRKLEEDAAVADARLDIALDEARANNPEIDLPAPGPAAPPPISTAEDILKEFE